MESVDATPSFHRGDFLFDLKSGAGFAGSLPAFLHKKITPGSARLIRADRLRRREDAFLTIAERAVFGSPSSPYLALFRRAGCEFGDLARMVSADGLEAALGRLLAEGVYLTVDEFKGRREAERGGTAAPCGPGLLRNPVTSRGVSSKSGGSRGEGAPLLLDFRFIAACAVNACLLLEAHGGSDWVKADWESPGGGALFRLLKLSRFGRRPARWFSQLDPASPGLHPRYRWSARALRWVSVVAAAPLPAVRHVPLDRPAPIVLWMRTVLEAGRTPFLFTFPSSAVKIALAAAELGLGLEGARFLVGGEPVTEARLSTIRASGAQAIPRYGSIECGPVSYGCLAPVEADDTHVNLDLYAAVQAGPEGGPPGLPPRAVFLTGLNPWTPYVLINVNLGDEAVLERRRCGCPLEAAGLGVHLRSIRSFEKLTGAGMTFMDTDVIRVLETDLPERFGGAATDYQVVEGEDGRGGPLLRLLIHPRLGPVDAVDAASFFLERIGRGSGVKRVMGLTWKAAGIVRVERRPPLPGPTGKILHLRADRRGPG
ncbi:MAG: hypothetical protein FJY83_09060 [Candidatus Aminicenantes bacterium]|nr:hypothetical protein [Candidatus Aminicenantes bacterium]